MRSSCSSPVLRSSTSPERCETCSGLRNRRFAGSTQLADAAFAGGITGIVGIVMAIVMIGAATSVGSDADPL